MSTWKILHNPKCGTSRRALEVLKSKKVVLQIIEYLKSPPSANDLDHILKLGNLEPEQVVRKKEDLYKEMKLADRKLSRTEWLKVLTDNPILIERPIVLNGLNTVLARPPEKLDELF